MMLRKVRRLPAHLRRRRLHLHGVGIGKSGTTTLAEMFRDYRAAHELDAERFVPISAGVLTGQYALDARRVRFELRRRQIRFRLEVDSADFLNPVAGTLAALFPGARFVLTIRDCFSWLDSSVEWRLKTTDAGIWAPMRDAMYGSSPAVFAPEEAPLRDAGLPPIAAYLRRWAQQNAAVLRRVPSERLLVVRTEDLSGAGDTLARFAGVPVGTVHPAHAKANTDRTGLLAQVPRDFIGERAREHCATLMEKYWGLDWYDLRARLPVRAPTR
jgi:hypothetical protein